MPQEQDECEVVELAHMGLPDKRLLSKDLAVRCAQPIVLSLDIKLVNCGMTNTVEFHAQGGDVGDGLR